MRQLAFLQVLAACVVTLMSRTGARANGSFDLPDGATPLIGFRPGSVGQATPPPGRTAAALIQPAAWVYGVSTMPPNITYQPSTTTVTGPAIYGATRDEVVSLEAGVPVATPTQGAPVVYDASQGVSLLLYETATSAPCWHIEDGAFTSVNPAPNIVLLSDNFHTGLHIMLTDYSITC
jgi:hypothetical protein